MKQRHFSHRFILFGGLLSLLCVVTLTAALALSGRIIEFPVPTANSTPHYIAAGPDGNLWFTERAANKIGRITPAGVITEFSSGLTANSNLQGITAGPDGNLWFSEGANASKIGRITTAGAITEFPIPANSDPTGITAGARRQPLVR